MSGTRLDLTGFRLTFGDEFNGFSSNGPSNPFATGHTGTWDTTYSYGERKLNDEAQWTVPFKRFLGSWGQNTMGFTPKRRATGFFDKS